MKKKNTEEEYKGGIGLNIFPKYFPLIFPEMAFKPKAIFERDIKLLKELEEKEKREKKEIEEKRKRTKNSINHKGEDDDKEKV